MIKTHLDTDKPECLELKGDTTVSLWPKNTNPEIVILV